MQDGYKSQISELFHNYVAFVKNKEKIAKKLCSAVKYVNLIEY
jgi:hypothetical protein